MDKRIAEEIRRFNRFYMDTVSFFDLHSIHPSMSDFECRILYEIREKSDITAKELSDALHIDRGYMSRTLAKLEKTGCIVRNESDIDRRRKHMRLTKKGRDVVELSIENANNNTQTQFGYLSEEDIDKVIGAMQLIEEIMLSNKSKEPSPATESN